MLKAAKGFRFGRSTKEAQAKEALHHAGRYAFAHRKQKKRTNRGLWQTKIAAVAKASGTSFSKLMGAATKKNVALDLCTQDWILLLDADEVLTPGLQKEIQDRIRAVVRKHDQRGDAAVGMVERFAFYERSKKAFAVVMTGETVKYGNIILKKGVIPVAK